MEEMNTISDNFFGKKEKETVIQQNRFEQCDNIKENNNINELPMIHVMTFLKTMFGNRLTIVDVYLAKHIGKKINNCVLVVIYEGEMLSITSCIIDNIIVEFIQRQIATLTLQDDVNNWNEFAKKEPVKYATYINAFYENKSAVSILEHNADVVAVFPSVIKQAHYHKNHNQLQNTNEFKQFSSESENSMILTFIPILVVMKEAPNFIAEGSTDIPDTILITGFGDVPVIVIKGYYEPYVLKTGSAVGNQLGEFGFGTLGAFVQSCNDDTKSTLYAVTCEHVVTRSKTDTISSSFGATNQLMIYSSPTPEWRKMQLIRSLGYATHCPNGNLIKNMDTLIEIAILNNTPEKIREIMAIHCPSLKTKTDFNNPDLISYVEMKKYTHHNLDVIGSNIVIVPPVKITVGTTQPIDCSGDIALIEMTFKTTTTKRVNCCSLSDIMDLLKLMNTNNSICVAQKGASGYSRKLGNISRPVHIQSNKTGSSDFWNKKPIKNPGNCYLCQIMIDGTGFGVKGDSGSSVYLVDLVTQQTGPLIGIFTGTLDCGNTVFIVSPIECLTKNKYEILEIVS